MRAAERPDIGVITTPGWAAQGVADLLVRAGVTSLLNFAPRVLTVPPTVHLRYVDLSIELQVLGFYRARGGGGPAPPGGGPHALDADGARRSGLSTAARNWPDGRPDGPDGTARAGDWHSGGRDRHNCEPTQEGTECPSSS